MTAVPSVSAVLKLTRTIGVLMLVRLSVEESPLSDDASRSGAAVGAAGGVVSRLWFWALVMSRMLPAPWMALVAAATVAVGVSVTEPPAPLLSRLARVALSVRSTAPVPMAVTRLATTAFAAWVLVSVPLGSDAASISRAAICAAAFCTATAVAPALPVASGSKVSRSTLCPPRPSAVWTRVSAVAAKVPGFSVM